MTKYLVLPLLTFALTSTCLSQQANQFLIPYESRGLWGYMNLDKKIVLGPQFDEAYPTYGQMGKVKKDGKYGFINHLGKVIIKLKYDTASDIQFGYVTVVKNNKKKNLNAEGKIKGYGIIALCGAGRSGLVLSSNIPFIYKGENGKYGFAIKKRVINEDQTVQLVADTVPPIFDTVISVANQHMFVVKDGKIAFTNSSYYGAGSKIILEKMFFKYDELKFFDSGREYGKHSIVGIKENNLWGYYDVYRDLQGEEIIEPKYYSITSLKNRFALVEFEPNRYGYIDKEGNEYFWRTNAPDAH